MNDSSTKGRPDGRERTTAATKGRSRPPRPGRTGLLVAGGALGLAALVTMIVLLAMALGELRASRDRIEAQDAKAAVMLQKAYPVLDESEPLLDDLAPLVGPSDRLIGSANDVLRPLSGAGEELATAARLMPGLALSARGLAQSAAPLVQGLSAVDLPAAVQVSGTLAAQLLYDTRLVESIDSAAAMLDELAQLDLLERLADSTDDIDHVLEIQRRTLHTQRESLDVQTQTLDVQLEALDHIRSIDEKTGGQAPGTAIPGP